jgi:hypothetical protein
VERARQRLALRRQYRLLGSGQPVAALACRGPRSIGDARRRQWWFRPPTNEDDNEITGIHVSDGDTSTNGILGQKLPHAFQGGWRVFYTQQHGDNFTWAVLEK